MLSLDELGKIEELMRKEKVFRQQFFRKLDEMSIHPEGSQEYQKAWDQKVEILKRIDEVMVAQVNLIGPKRLRLLWLRRRAPAGMKAEKTINEMID